jgi:succinyldiaminopimelate transaminase
LPAFPWDQLTAAAATARRHPGGIVDLSVGTPVDPTPELVQRALGSAADAPGYPRTAGTPALREAAAAWLARRFGVTGLVADAVLPTIGSKELVAALPAQLGLGPADTVVVPRTAYPTYAVGAALAGCEVVATDSTLALGPRRPALVWLNSPANPTGRVLPAEHLAKVVAWARERDAVVVADECYLEYGWDADPVSLLHPSVSGGSLDNLLSVHSMSKRSNLAGYRAGFVAGDARLVSELLAVRKHAGLMVPAPVQEAMRVALGDDHHVAAQRQRYAGRRERLWAALLGAGFAIDHSQAGLYLWATRDEPSWDSVAWFADRGILVAPGEFYGAAGRRHVRVAITASDERVSAAVARL